MPKQIVYNPATGEIITGPFRTNALIVGLELGLLAGTQVYRFLEAGEHMKKIALASIPAVIDSLLQPRRTCRRTSW